MAKVRSAAAVLALVFALSLLACSSSDGPAPTPAPTPAPADDDAPTLTAHIGGRLIEMSPGNTQWRGPGWSSVGDAFGIMTNWFAEPVPRGNAMTITGDLPWTQLSAVVLDVHPPIPAMPGSDLGGWRWAGTPQPLPFDVTDAGLTFLVDLAPGTHVIRLKLTVDEPARPSSWGTAEYGLLIDVTE